MVRFCLPTVAAVSSADDGSRRSVIRDQHVNEMVPAQERVAGHSVNQQPSEGSVSGEIRQVLGMKLAGAYWGESGISKLLRAGLARMDMLEKALVGLSERDRTEPVEGAPCL